jgi:TolB-like protein
MAIVLRFATFELDTRALELRREGVRVRLRPQPAQMLAHLARRPGVLVTRDELRAELWPAGTFVRFDQGLNSCVKQIRAVLGDNPRRPRFVETLSRRGYRFVAPVTEVPETVPASRPRLAVLPFDAIDAPVDPAQRPLIDGFIEELTTRLACFRPDQLGVIARTSVERYRHSGRPAADIGRELDVEYLVEGSVRRGGDRLRITAQLISVHDETHVWARSYEGEAANPLQWQDQMAVRIAHEIAAALQVPGPA